MTALTHEQARQFLELGREQLSGGERAVLDRHVADCAQCRSYAAELAALQAAVGRVMRNHWKDVRLDPQLENRVQAQIRTNPMPKKILSNALGLAGLVVFTVILIAFFSAQTQPTAIKSPIATPLGTPVGAPFLTPTPTRVGEPFPTPTPLSSSDFYQLQRLTTTAYNGYRPVVSPDGRRVIYAAERDGNAGIFAFDLTTQSETHLTTDTFRDLEASWSPGGARIAYEHVVPSADGSTSTIERIVINADGSNKQVVSSGAPWSAGSEAPAWSPDGTRLAFTDGTELVVINVADGRELGRFGPVDVLVHSQPAWVDDERIMFVSEKAVKLADVASGRVETVVGTAEGVQALVMPPYVAYIQQDGSVARLRRVNLDDTQSTIGVFESGMIGGAVSSPDGRFVAVETDQGLYVATEQVPAPWQHAPLFKLDASMPPAYLRGVSWLPDSSGFVFVAAPDGQPALYLARLNLGAIKIVEDNEPVAQVPPRLSVLTPTPTLTPYPHKRFNTLWILTEPSGGAYLPVVSPDGRRVIYTSVRNGNWDIYLVDFATLAETRLTDDPRTDTASAWSPDGSRIAYQRYASAATGPQSTEWVVMNADGSNPQVVAIGVQQPDNERPAWSPDGTRLAFTTGTKLVVVSLTDRRELRRFDLTEKQLRSQPVWFDNDQILFISQGVLQLGHVATGVSQPVAGPSGFVSQVMARNSAIVYIQQDGITAHVIGQNLDGTEAVTLTTLTGVSTVAQSGPIESAALSPDGRYVAVQTDQGLYVAYIAAKQSEDAPPADLLTDVLGVSWLPDSSGFVCAASPDRPDDPPILYLVQPEPGSEDEPFSPLILPTLTPTPTRVGETLPTSTPSTGPRFTPTPTLPLPTSTAIP